MLDEERVEDDERQRADQGAGHQRAPFVDVAVDEFVDDRHRHGLVRRRLQEGQRVDEFVPAQREAEDEGRDQPRHRQRNDDLDQDLPARGAVDQRAFLELERDGLEIAHQQPGRERDQQRRIHQDQRQRRVEQAVGLDHRGERNEQDRRRHQIRQEDRAADGVGTAEAQPHDRIGGEHAGGDRQHGGSRRDIHRVPQPARILGFEQQLLDVLQRRMHHPERVVGLHVDQLLVGFDRRQPHPVEREQQHDEDDEQRQIQRHQPARQRLQIAHALAVVALRDGGGRFDGEPGIGGGGLSHCRSPAAICAAACRTTRSRSPRAGTGSSRWQSPRPPRAGPTECRADSSASPSDAWR